MENVNKYLLEDKNKDEKDIRYIVKEMILLNYRMSVSFMNFQLKQLKLFFNK